VSSQLDTFLGQVLSVPAMSKGMQAHLKSLLQMDQHGISASEMLWQLP
jgi:hypothetical protein